MNGANNAKAKTMLHLSDQNHFKTFVHDKYFASILLASLVGIA